MPKGVGCTCESLSKKCAFHQLPLRPGSDSGLKLGCWGAGSCGHRDARTHRPSFTLPGATKGLGLVRVLEWLDKSCDQDAMPLCMIVQAFMLLADDEDPGVTLFKMS